LNIATNNTLPKIAILGATGSIGDTFFRLVRQFPNQVEIAAIVGGSNYSKAYALAEEFRPSVVCLESVVGVDVRHLQSKFKVVCNDFYLGSNAGLEALNLVDVDIVVCAITGIAGLRSCYRAVSLGKSVLLANKESLVCAGQLIKMTAKESSARIISIDSEHSAIEQLLEGRSRDVNTFPSLAEVNKLILTASGGPFREYSQERLKAVTPEQAVNHPRWQMGAKISVDSATMVNKALEVAEAFWLFESKISDIDVLVHPQSIFHALIELCDGSLLAQLGATDMVGPISYALSRALGRARFSDILRRPSIDQLRELNFYAVDEELFPAIKIMKSCLQSGGTAPCIFNSANEFAVAAFLEKKIAFLDITYCIDLALNKFSSSSYSSIDELLNLHTEIAEYLASAVTNS
jgi:1-deoxy-D-xylulose-5-phosphate reductoisomerase